jgi:hypothetical protein
MSQFNSSRIHVMIFSAATMALVGCSGGGGTTTSTPEGEHIKKIPGLVNDYKTAMKKQPSSLEEVRDWAVKEGKAKEGDFVSTRDKELYGIAFSGMGVVVHEQTGKNGKCYILRMGGASEISAEEVRRIVAQEKKHASGKSG